MRVIRLAVGATLALVLVGAGRAQAVPETPAPQGASGAIRTDRLSRRQRKTWNAIMRIVTARDREGVPLYPTLRALWDAVDTSTHTVFIEIADSKGTRSYLGGRFEVTRVDPEGRAHEGRLILNLRAIDWASTATGAARSDGFIPFEGLGKKERYAEVLGHELAHAVWHLADTEWARLATQLQAELERLIERPSEERVRCPDAEPSERAAILNRLARELEEPAEAAERAIWKELRSRRSAVTLSASSRSPATFLTRKGPEMVAVLRAWTSAQRRLREPGCRCLLTDFREGEQRRGPANPRAAPRKEPVNLRGEVRLVPKARPATASRAASPSPHPPMRP